MIDQRNGLPVSGHTEPAGQEPDRNGHAIGITQRNRGIGVPDTRDTRLCGREPVFHQFQFFLKSPGQSGFLVVPVRQRKRVHLGSDRPLRYLLFLAVCSAGTKDGNDFVFLPVRRERDQRVSPRKKNS